MNKEFIPYDSASILKELGFDEECFKKYFKDDNGIGLVGDNCTNTYIKQFYNYKNKHCSAPLWQQAFDWFRIHKKLEYHIKSDMRGYYTYIVDRNTHKTVSMKPINMFETYEEARLECLKELINLVKKT
jgi:hypothetical protein